jgi:hypothetical protein
MQTNAFCFFFWKKKNTARTVGPPAVRLVVFEGVGGFRRGLGQKTFCKAEQRFLLLFLEKEDYH